MTSTNRDTKLSHKIARMLISMLKSSWLLILLFTLINPIHGLDAETVLNKNPLKSISYPAGQQDVRSMVDGNLNKVNENLKDHFNWT